MFVDPNISIALIGIGVMVVLILLRLPIAVAMGLVGVAGFTYLSGWDAMLGLMKTVPYTTAKDYSLSVIPLFVLMGNFALTAGLSKDLYRLGDKLLGHLPGGLAMATIVACAGFGAICGSAPATAATMGIVSIPEMRKYNYAPSLACGCVAAGGCLGLLIPPSVGFIIYGILVGESIGKLFMAGLGAGILLMILYCLVVLFIAVRNPELAPRGEKATFRERLQALKGVWGVLLLFVLVIGGMMGGFFTATEGAAVGACGALLFSLFHRTMTREAFVKALLETGRTTAMIFAIFIGAYILGYFLTVTQMPASLAALITGANIHRYVVIIGIFFVYVFLGCIMDSLAMVLITVPIFYPSVMALGFDPIWFGVFIVLVINQGLLTPPVGMNAFVIKGIAKDVPLSTVFRGILPFWVAIFVAVILVLLFPEIVLFLPRIAS
ncbi:MAG: TRAP transporter large permease [Gracilibacteraceae bacterium]|jgi:tripartite ATP-independent transporter DctM subunit|nr:TRAP transporter large permease [Gracilibacteraceae bacterium]